MSYHDDYCIDCHATCTIMYMFEYSYIVKVVGLAWSSNMLLNVKDCSHIVHA